ncbi:MAG: hypothetical protein ACOC22_04460 [bacterium]
MDLFSDVKKDDKNFNKKISCDDGTVSDNMNYGEYINGYTTGNHNINFEGYDGTIEAGTTTITTTSIYHTNMLDAKLAREKAIEYIRNLEVTKRIVSMIEDVAMVGEFKLTYDYSDDEKEGKWHSGIVDYFEEVLDFDVDINGQSKIFRISWDL